MHAIVARIDTLQYYCDEYQVSVLSSPCVGACTSACRALQIRMSIGQKSIRPAITVIHTVGLVLTISWPSFVKTLIGVPALRISDTRASDIVSETPISNSSSFLSVLELLQGYD